VEDGVALHPSGDDQFLLLRDSLGGLVRNGLVRGGQREATAQQG